MGDVWVPSDFLIAATYGVPASVHGYVYRGLGLHMSMRESPKGRRPPTWALTHLNTGHRICAIKGSVATAFPIATKFAESGDWDFSSLIGWKDRSPNLMNNVRAVLREHADECSRSTVGADEAAAREIAISRMDA